MNTKTLLAGLVGGVVAFLLGWLLYGILLLDFMKANTNQCMNLDMKDMNMVTMIISNLLWGLLLALILGWANVTSFMGGLMKGAMYGILLALAFDLQFSSMTTYFNNMNAMIADVAVTTVMNALVGGVVGWMLGRGSSAAA